MSLKFQGITNPTLLTVIGLCQLSLCAALLSFSHIGEKRSYYERFRALGEYAEEAHTLDGLVHVLDAAIGVDFLSEQAVIVRGQYIAWSRDARQIGQPFQPDRMHDWHAFDLRNGLALYIGRPGEAWLSQRRVRSWLLWALAVLSALSLSHQIPRLKEIWLSSAQKSRERRISSVQAAQRKSEHAVPGTAAVVFDRSTLRVCSANAAFCEMMGGPYDALHDRYIFDMLPILQMSGQKSMELVENALAVLSQDSVPVYRLDLQVLDLSGVARWVSSESILHHEGQTTFLVTHLRDASEKCGAIIDRDRLNAAYESSPCAIVSLDNDCAVECLNPSAMELFKIESEDELPSDVRVFFDRGNTGYYNHKVLEEARVKGSWLGRLPIHDADGDKTLVEHVVSARRGPDGQHAGFYTLSFRSPNVGAAPIIASQDVDFSVPVLHVSPVNGVITFANQAFEDQFEFRNPIGRKIMGLIESTVTLEDILETENLCPVVWAPSAQRCNLVCAGASEYGAVLLIFPISLGVF